MTNYGIQVAKPGKSALSKDSRDLVYSSKYQTLRVLKTGAGTITNSNRSFTFYHGLGYAPFFIAHAQTDVNAGASEGSTDYNIVPYAFRNTNVSPYKEGVKAWVDTQNLYISASSNYGVRKFDSSTQSIDEAWATESSFSGYQHGFYTMGFFNTLSETIHGAVRIGNVSIAQGTTITSATLNVLINFRQGSGQVNLNVYGIAEDNTAAFNTGTAATARVKTSAVTASNTIHQVNDYLGVDVTSQVQEIVNRAGWASGNYMGFILNDNGTTGDNYYENQGNDTSTSYLQVVTNSNLGNFKYTIFQNPIML